MKNISLSSCPSKHWGIEMSNSKLGISHDIKPLSDQSSISKPERLSETKVAFYSRVNNKVASLLSPSRLSLKWSLLLAFTLFSALPILLFSNWVQESILSRKIDTLRDSQTLIAQSASIKLSQYLSQVSDEFIQLSGTAQSVFDEERGYISATDNVRWLAKAHVSGLDEPNKYDFYTSLGSDDYAPGVSDQWLNTYISQAMKKPGSVIFSESVRDGNGVPSIYLVYSDRDNVHDISVGALCLDALEDTRATLSGGNHGEIVVLDAGGAVIAPAGSSADLAPNSVAGADFVDGLLRGKSGSAVYYSEVKGQEMLAGYAPIPLGSSTRWGMVVSQPHMSLTEGARAMREASWVVIAIVLVFAVILSYFMTLIILKPFNFLASVVGEYALDTEAGLSRFKQIDCSSYKSKIYFAELSNITRVVKKMAGDLTTYHENMEAKVAERSEVIEKKNAQRRRVEKQLRYVSSHDTLTGLPNAHLFEDRVDSAIQWSNAAGLKVAVVVIKLLGIDEVQQAYSHIVSDSMIKSLAERLKQELSENDTLARTGAYEFTALLMNVKSEDATTELVERLSELTKDIHSYESKTLSVAPNVTVSASISIAVSSENTSDLESLLDKAEGAFVMS